MTKHMAEELKPVNCRCGGEAAVLLGESTTYFEVKCCRCGTKTVLKRTRNEAIETWNKVMGADKDKITATKGYWMSTYDGLHCSVCNYKCETTVSPSICPHCGTNMKIVNVYPCTTPNGTYTGGCTFTNTTDPNKDFHPVRDFMVGVERTAKVRDKKEDLMVDEWHHGRCLNCGKQVRRRDNYCSRCGCRLIWEEDIPMEYFESGGI